MEGLSPYIGDGDYHGVELIKPLEVGKLKCIVTGTGRCGTVYMAKLLTSIGYACGHEAIFRNDGFDHALARMRNEEEIEISLIAKLASVEDEGQGVSWFNSPMPPPLVADSSYMVAPYLDRPELEDVKVIHVVREPMKVINSFVEGFQYFRNELSDELRPYHEFIYQFVPELRLPMDPLSRAALYYIKWNEMIEQKCQHKRKNYLCHRAETDVNKVLSFLGVQKTDKTYQNKRSNYKLGLLDTYTSISQIPMEKIRFMLHRIRNRYYQPKLA